MKKVFSFLKTFMFNISKGLFFVLALAAVTCLACSSKPGQENPVSGTPHIEARQANVTPALSNKMETVAVEATSSPISINGVTEREGNPPMRIYTFNIDFINHHAEPVWLVTRHMGDEPLNKLGRFDSGGQFDVPFETTQFTSMLEGGKGQCAVVEYLGANGFNALHLPSRGTIKFDTFQLEAWNTISDFEVWEVSALLVNGKTPLEKWLPYNTLADQGVHITLKANRISLDWDARLAKDRQDYPNEKIEFITANIIKKWTLPFKALRADLRLRRDGQTPHPDERQSSRHLRSPAETN